MFPNERLRIVWVGDDHQGDKAAGVDIDPTPVPGYIAVTLVQRPDTRIPVYVRVAEFIAQVHAALDPEYSPASEGVTFGGVDTAGTYDLARDIHIFVRPDTIATVPGLLELGFHQENPDGGSPISTTFRALSPAVLLDLAARCSNVDLWES